MEFLSCIVEVGGTFVKLLKLTPITPDRCVQNVKNNLLVQKVFLINWKKSGEKKGKQETVISLFTHDHVDITNYDSHSNYCSQ